ncbi:hypothetical protein B0H14DRAFT_3423794 [Mycena olivaceomarginata]|nr:hypothetical protein B0H14DRAFT_3423794 [Mycena olivaceomarginata]
MRIKKTKEAARTREKEKSAATQAEVDATDPEYVPPSDKEDIEGLGKLGDLRADATGALLQLVVVRSTVSARRSVRGDAQALIELLPSSFELRDLNFDEDLR